MRRLTWSFAFGLIIAAACADQSVSRSGIPDDDSQPSDESDGGTSGVDAAPLPGDGGVCPPPGVLAPTQVGAGFLRPQKVTLVRPVDGDTAHFDFPNSPDETCRFLWIDTEETTGAEMTAFGAQAKAAVAGYLQAAKEIVVVVRQSATNAGQPDLDPYGRWLSLVFVDGDLLQTRIVREGWAPYYTQFGCAPEPIHSTLLHAEAEANAAKRGIWEANHPLDYASSVGRWIGRRPWCRPNPFESAYCN